MNQLWTHNMKEKTLDKRKMNIITFDDKWKEFNHVSFLKASDFSLSFPHWLFPD